MKLTALKSLILPGIEFPELVAVPPFADKSFASRVFGAFCRINPELDCMQDRAFLKNVAKVLDAAGYTGVFSTLPKEVEANPEIKKWRAWYAEEKERKAAFRKENAESLKAKREELKSKYGYALVNGEKENLGSWVVEPEGFYFGRGDSPIKGMWKQAVMPEDIVVNTNGPVPVMIAGEQVKKFAFEKTWNPECHSAAHYPVKVGIPNKEGKVLKPAFQTQKDIQFSQTSSIKKEGQVKKYEAGEALLKIQGKLEDRIEECFTTGSSLEDAIAIYIMLNKGIRVGTSTETQNGTKGLLALEWGKDVKRVGNSLKFSFVGKDSVKDTSSLEIPADKLDKIEKVWKKSGKLNSTYETLKEFVKAVDSSVTFSPKLLRTLVAASVMTKALKEVTKKYKLTKDSSEALKKLAFNEANMEVAKKLNHQTNVSKAAEERKAAKFKETQAKLKDKEVKAKELETKRKARLKVLIEKGKTEEAKKLRETMAKSKESLKMAKMNASFKEGNADFTGSTSKAAYIDPKIVSNWCEKVGLDISKVYTKTQLEQFSERI